VKRGRADALRAPLKLTLDLALLGCPRDAFDMGSPRPGRNPAVEPGRGLARKIHEALAGVDQAVEIV
jgi:hypothetical protein